MRFLIVLSIIVFPNISFAQSSSFDDLLRDMDETASKATMYSEVDQRRRLASSCSGNPRGLSFCNCLANTTISHFGDTLLTELYLEYMDYAKEHRGQYNAEATIIRKTENWAIAHNFDRSMMINWENKRVTMADTWRRECY